MAWLDDRIWCAPKLTDLSSPAFRAWVNGIAYSAGMATKGHLTLAQQRLVGANSKIKNELVKAGLWDRKSSGSEVVIHDWDDHNSKRDERREKDRLRKKSARASAGQSTGRSAGRSTGKAGTESTGQAHVDGSEGSEEELTPNPNPALPKTNGSQADADIDFETVLKKAPA